MREIKFRACVPHLKEMREVVSIDFISDTLKTKGDDTLFNFNENFAENFDTARLMQFTGLKDCNGKEIYEGDIIKAKTVMESMPIWIGEVMRECDYIGIDKNECAEWVIVDKKLGSYIAFYPKQDREIIGNIYENLELLK